MHNFPKGLEEEIITRKKQNNYRKLICQDNLIDFSSNDYLGLSTSSRLHKLVIKEILKYDKRGSTGSRLLTGNNIYTEELENLLAEYFKSEAGLLFNSGYTANLGFYSCIPKRNDIIIYDELIHASIRDGILISFAKSLSFKHNDPDDLERLLFNNNNNEKYVAIESIYSMDGDMAPLKSIIKVCNKYDAYIILDEAHSTGIYGEYGEGLALELGIENFFLARLHTFGKAIGAHGAFWTGSRKLKNYLINFCRPFIYSTALSMYSLANIKIAIRYLKDHKELIDKLRDNINFFKLEIIKNNINSFIESKSPIQSIIIPTNDKVKYASKYLIANGFDVRPILYPTIPRNNERLRISIHSINSKQEISNLISSLIHIHEI